MSHFALHAFVPEGVDPEEYLEEALEPYNENRPVDPYLDETLSQDAIDTIRAFYVENPGIGPDKDDDLSLLESYYGEENIRRNEETGEWEVWSTLNPLREWDWWVIGGRWNGFFPDGQDIITASDLDWTDARKKARNRAEAEYDHFEFETTGLTFTPWENVKALIDDIDEARRVYRGQAWVKAALEVMGGEFVWGSPESHFKVNEGGREAFIREAVDSVGLPYAYLDLDGKWNERGEMGWFGLSNDHMTTSEWAASYSDYLDRVKALDSGARVVMVDCHI